VVINPDGSFSFQPGLDFQDLGAGEIRDVSFTFQATDRHGAVSNLATIVIGVLGENDAPELSSPLPNVAVDQGSESLSVDLSATFTDKDGPFVLSARSSDESLVTTSVVGTELILAFPPSESGAAIITITADDGQGGLASTSFDVTVLNTVPSISAVTSTAASLATRSADGTVQLAGNFTDLGTDVHTVVVDWGDGMSGSVAVDQFSDSFAGQHHYPAGGIYTIVVTVTDSNGANAQAQTQAVVEGVGLVGGTLYVIGTDEKDDIEVEVDSRRNRVEVDAKLGRGRDARRIESTYAVSEVDQAVAYLFDGDDQYKIKQKSSSSSNPQTMLPQLVFGGAGDDRITSDRDYLGMLEIHGQEGDDRIDAGHGDDVLYGGPGKDRINGGPGSDVIFGGDGDDHLNGGSEGRWENGNDIIVGGAGDDRISGGRGRDLLIGGTGEDDIRVNSGGDLLIGGFTAYDLSLDTLRRIHKEWTSERSYEERIENLRNGTGPLLAGSGIQLKGSGAAATVFDDGQQDRLRGGSGSDWYFAQLAGTDDDDRVWKNRHENIDLLGD
jgi:Ca2+-binding RTX toxin-like protein